MKTSFPQEDLNIATQNFSVNAVNAMKLNCVSERFSSRWIRVNKEPYDRREISFNDLDEGAEYNYRVCAVNEAGEGKPCDETGVFKAKDPYDKPGKPGTPEVSAVQSVLVGLLFFLQQWACSIQVASWLTRLARRVHGTRRTGRGNCIVSSQCTNSQTI